ncbi:unnamed protein product [Somion occarium]|uniref:Zn(2)-C6 fungal-type domain-containing protein n=1 Tax=Somion occarium TaxID=3059160 RepID=A0ABP1DKL3_9APHY
MAKQYAPQLEVPRTSTTSRHRTYPPLRMKAPRLEIPKASSYESTRDPLPRRVASRSPLLGESETRPGSTLPKSASSDCDLASSGMWQLVPYDIPWGHDYYRYKVGCLPGPGGACIFLRTPTPVEKRRTTQACVTCRERKAKCSGSRPACARCLSRGVSCEYGPDPKRNRVESKQTQRYHHSFPHPYSPRDSCSSSVSSTSDRFDDSPLPYASSEFSPKFEDESLAVLSPSPAWTSYTTSSDTQQTSSRTNVGNFGGDERTSFLDQKHDLLRRPSNIPSFGPIEPAPSMVSPNTVSLVAPQPRRLSPISTLEQRVRSSEETAFALQHTTATPLSPTTVDPRMLDHQILNIHCPDSYVDPSAVSYYTENYCISYEPGSQGDYISQTGFVEVAQRYYGVSTYIPEPVYENPAPAQFTAVAVPHHLQTPDVPPYARPSFVPAYSVYA